MTQSKIEWATRSDWNPEDRNMTDTLADVLPREITRVRQVQNTYKALQWQMPNVIVAPQIALMERDIQAAVTACAQGDVVEMLRTLGALKGWEE